MSKNEKQSLAMKKIWAERKLKQVAKRKYTRRSGVVKANTADKRARMQFGQPGEELFRVWLQSFAALNAIILNQSRD